jgi:hypothetical protein
MKRNFAKLVSPAATRLIVFALLATLVGLASTTAAQAQSTTSASLKIIRGYQSTTSSSGVVLMTVPGLGKVQVDCSGGLSRIAFYPAVSGSLWFTHEGGTAFASGTAGTQLSNQATDDVITAQFATTTQTVTMVISGHPGSPCLYAGQAIVQP